MPSVSEKQRRFFGAELARKRAGKETKTGMGAKKLRHFAGAVKSYMPAGSSQTPKGDVGKKRQQEAKSTRKKFKGTRAVDAASYFPDRPVRQASDPDYKC